jgi:hypothetical protein
MHVACCMLQIYIKQTNKTKQYVNTRQKFLHNSRHKHAKRRARGPGGRFLTKPELEAIALEEQRQRQRNGINDTDNNDNGNGSRGASSATTGGAGAPGSSSTNLRQEANIDAGGREPPQHEQQQLRLQRLQPQH